MVYYPKRDYIGALLWSFHSLHKHSPGGILPFHQILIPADVYQGCTMRFCLGFQQVLSMTFSHSLKSIMNFVTNSESTCFTFVLQISEPTWFSFIRFFNYFMYGCLTFQNAIKGNRTIFTISFPWHRIFSLVTNNSTRNMHTLIPLTTHKVFLIGVPI